MWEILVKKKRSHYRSKSQDEEVRASKKVRTEENSTEIPRHFERKINDEPKEVDDRRLIAATSRNSSLNILQSEMETEQMSFMCTQCGKEFATDDLMTTHTEYAHEEIRTKCKDCDTVLLTNASLHNHMIQQHLADSLRGWKAMVVL